MNLNEFDYYYLNELLHKLSSALVLLGDFNVDLMKYDNHHPTNELPNSLSSQKQNLKNYFKCISWIPVLNKFSSHFRLFCFFQIYCSQNIIV